MVVRQPEPELPTFEFDVVTVNAQGKEASRRRKRASYFSEDLGNGITLEMVAIPGGTFMMGSPETEAGRRKGEGPQHEVTVPTFFMGRYPVTQAQWEAIAALPQVNRQLKSNPSGFKGSTRPVENVARNEAVEFCDRLSRKVLKPRRSGVVGSFSGGGTVQQAIALLG